MKQPESLWEAFEMQAEANRTAPRFYGKTWHDTRENAMKCPPCKEVVLREEEAARKAAAEAARQARTDTRRPGAIVNVVNPVEWTRASRVDEQFHPYDGAPGKGGRCVFAWAPPGEGRCWRPANDVIHQSYSAFLCRCGDPKPHTH